MCVKVREGSALSMSAMWVLPEIELNWLRKPFSAEPSQAPYCLFLKSWLARLPLLKRRHSEPSVWSWSTTVAVEGLGPAATYHTASGLNKEAPSRSLLKRCKSPWKLPRKGRCFFHSRSCLIQELGWNQLIIKKDLCELILVSFETISTLAFPLHTPGLWICHGLPSFQRLSTLPLRTLKSIPPFKPLFSSASFL